MSFQRIRNIKKTKTKHHCEGCLQVIPIGSEAQYCTGVFQGDFYAYYFCQECQSFCEQLDDDVQKDLAEYGFMPGDIGDMRKQIIV